MNTEVNPIVECVSTGTLMTEEKAVEVDKSEFPLQIKSYAAHVEIEPSEERTEVSIIATEHKDFVDEIVSIEGLNLSHFRAAGKVLYQHDHKQPIGKCVWIKAIKDTLRAKSHYPIDPSPETGKEWYIDEIWKLISSKILGHKSIGFLPLEDKSDPTDDELKAHPEWESGKIWRKSKLIEYSATSIPMNSGCFIEMISTKSLDPEHMKILGIELPVIPVVEKAVEDEWDAIIKSDDCVSRTVKEMYDKGEDKGRTKAQIVAVAYSKCGEKKEVPKKKSINYNKIIGQILDGITFDEAKIIERVKSVYKNRGRV